MPESVGTPPLPPVVEPSPLRKWVLFLLRPIWWARGALIAALLGLIACAGCNAGLGDIDRQVNKTIEARSAALGRDTVSPVLQYQKTDGQPEADQYDEDPATVNPDADQLEFTPANEARDVTARLNEFAAQAAGADAPPGDILDLDLEDIFQIAHQTAREYITAEESYMLAAIRLLIERHQWGPRLFNDTTVQLTGFGEDGNYQHALDIINNLRVTQRLPYGGSVEAAWIVRATDQLRESATTGYRSSSELVLSGEIPLLRGAGQVAREELIQAERDLVYAARTFERFRRELLVSIARDYFNLLNLQARIANQERQIMSLGEVEEATAAKVEAGREPEFRLNIVTNQRLQSEASLANQRETYILAVDRFKVRLGLPVDQPVVILPFDLTVPEPDVSLDVAATRALSYRLDLQNSRDRVADARRRLDNARNDTLADLDLFGEVNVPTDPSDLTGGLSIDGEQLDYRAGFRLGLPLDRKIERLNVRQADIQFQRTQRDYDERRDNVTVQVRSDVRSIDLARFQLELAERQVEINRRRQEEQFIKADEVDAQSFVDTENDLLQSENDRDAAITDLRNAVLDYLLSSGQLRVQPGGQFRRLPGMPVQPIAPEEMLDE